MLAKREGYIVKKWFCGTYELNADASDSGGGGSSAFHDNAWANTGVDARGQTRASASGYYGSTNSYWWQHDYFVHSGTINSTDGVESGFWLPSQWCLPVNGGFDGRWVQLFDEMEAQLHLPRLARHQGVRAGRHDRNSHLWA